MLYFAVTLKVNHRNGFNEDLQILRDGIKYILSTCTEQYIAPYKFELQPEGLHNMHVHILIGSTKPLKYKTIHDMFKQMDIHCHIKQIEHRQDAEIWLRYCNKYNGDLAYDYAESSGKDYAKEKLFNKHQCKNRVTTAQPEMTAQQEKEYQEWYSTALCVFCGKLQKNCYKCLIDGDIE